VPHCCSVDRSCTGIIEQVNVGLGDTERFQLLDRLLRLLPIVDNRDEVVFRVEHPELCWIVEAGFLPGRRWSMFGMGLVWHSAFLQTVSCEKKREAHDQGKHNRSTRRLATAARRGATPWRR